MAFYQPPFTNSGRRSQSPLNDPRRSQNISPNNYEDQIGANELVDPPRLPYHQYHHSGSYSGSQTSEGHEGHDVSEGHYDYATYGGYPPSPISDYKHTSIPGSQISEGHDVSEGHYDYATYGGYPPSPITEYKHASIPASGSSFESGHKGAEYSTPSPFNPRKSWRDALVADIVDPRPPSSASDYPPYLDGNGRIRKIVLRAACTFIFLLIISIIVILVIGLVNYMKCKNMSYDNSSFIQEVYIDHSPNGKNWTFLQNGQFFEANLNVHTQKSPNSSIHVLTHMVSANGQDVIALEDSNNGTYTFSHLTPVKSPDWKNYLTFPPICAKVQVDLFYPSAITFKFILDEYGFTVSNISDTP